MGDRGQKTNQLNNEPRPGGVRRHPSQSPAACLAVRSFVGGDASVLSCPRQSQSASQSGAAPTNAPLQAPMIAGRAIRDANNASDQRWGGAALISKYYQGGEPMQKWIPPEGICLTTEYKPTSREWCLACEEPEPCGFKPVRGLFEGVIRWTGCVPEDTNLEQLGRENWRPE